MIQKITLEFRVNWILLIALVSVALVAAHILVEEQYRDSLIFAASVIGGAGALIAAVTAIDSRGDQLRQQKAAAALHFIQMWLNPQFFHAKKNGREILLALKSKQSVSDQQAYLDADPVRLANLIDVINFLEAIAVGIRQDHVDEETAKNFFRSITVEYWNGVEAFIKKRRAERMNTRLFAQLEWVYDRWKT